MLGVLVGFALVLVATVGLTARHAYRTFPDVVPREETALSGREYELVRAGVVTGGAVGALGAAVAIVDTAGTVSAAGTRPRNRDAVGEVAAAIPEWVATAGLYAGAGILVGCALVALASEVRARSS